MNVEVTPLPGIGTRQDFQTRSGKRVGVITHRDGRFELIVSRNDDPDACSASIPLTAEETATLSSLLGAPQLVSHLGRNTGIETRQLPIAPGSPFAAATLGDTALRTRTGASVVAVVRAGTVHPSPGPEFGFAAGDLVVVVGTEDGLTAAAAILAEG
ncbi:TrkA domain protein [Kutzneria viridogrisea]|uniref:TrkA-C domain-containing protein n=2 Tax=Kutzneria TaxID=43356 RepID=W5W650_9PSEU|nr:cation:proton antiporter regulatory subunit [Kutzneria albida]AHH96235.1 TrkA-C domain-containing protein [Kutzneria albida DSM 43870]MBA8928552.1 TrkA domain protein [Kutzneria viridogrisea]